MPVLVAIGGLVLLAVILWDAFETIILPRRITRRLRLARLFYRCTWAPWSAVARRLRAGRRRESFLSFYGPLSVPLLFTVWAMGLVVSFALLHWAAGSALNTPNERPTFWTDLYISGTTFSTLGLGDVTPRTPLARLITVIEAGTGFGVLAIVISYLPVLYGAFSNREVNISLLDARAGSPPTAAELLARHGRANREALAQYLRDWESWSAQLLESHMSYPVLCFFRSQHNNQSWLGALTAVLDACAALIACGDDPLRWQARLTFAISRHAVVDLAQVMNAPPEPPLAERLVPVDLSRFRSVIESAGLLSCPASVAEHKLSELRRMYEPYVNALAKRLLMALPPWVMAAGPVDNWRTSAWERIATEPSSLPVSAEEEHF